MNSPDRERFSKTRKLRTVLNGLNPDLTAERKLRQAQDAYRKYGDFLQRSLSVDDLVFVRNYGQGPKWFPATVIKLTGPVSYQAVTTGGDIVKRHVDQMRKRIPDRLTVPPDPSVASPPAEPQNPETEVPSSIPSSTDAKSTVVESTISSSRTDFEAKTYHRQAKQVQALCSILGQGVL
ncbi:uncharacterized protein [Parasteatoda tepidariorum]|uniref:uncharacterized protein n=1 Tax=Parasteatoda tepidariorum TaxID=114398 RepID=UPI0039BC2F21